MLSIGTKVIGPHGAGEVVGMNPNHPSKYLFEKPADALEIAMATGLVAGLMGSFYTSDVYPYIVKFENGYSDVYAESDLKVN